MTSTVLTLHSLYALMWGKKKNFGPLLSRYASSCARRAKSRRRESQRPIPLRFQLVRNSNLEVSSSLCSYHLAPKMCARPAAAAHRACELCIHYLSCVRMALCFMRETGPIYQQSSVSPRCTSKAPAASLTTFRLALISWHHSEGRFVVLLPRFGSHKELLQFHFYLNNTKKNLRLSFESTSTYVTTPPYYLIQPYLFE